MIGGISIFSLQMNLLQILKLNAFVAPTVYNLLNLPGYLDLYSL